ncbi:hypothetical protein U1Q18_025888, partial [Sarracenia purpurea var. burkii]
MGEKKRERKREGEKLAILAPSLAQIDVVDVRRKMNRKDEEGKRGTKLMTKDLACSREQIEDGSMSPLLRS